jgi:hypothetical protein
MSEQRQKKTEQVMPPEEEWRNILDALDSLYDGLREAKALFDDVSPDTHKGREGAIHALETVLKFLSRWQPILDEALQTPLARLFNDLMALDKNNVSPMLKPTPRSGRAPASAMYESLKGSAAYTVKRLESTGLTIPEAHTLVAKELNKVGMRPARAGADGGDNVFSERTIRKWCEDVSADVGCRGEAAQTKALLEDRFVSEVLKGLGLANLPEGQTPDSLLADQDVCSLRRIFLEQMTFAAEEIRAGETT